MQLPDFYSAINPKNPRAAPTLAPTAAVGKEAAPVLVAVLVAVLNVGLCTAGEVLLALMTSVRADDAETMDAEAVTAAEPGAEVAYIEATTVGVASGYS